MPTQLAFRPYSYLPLLGALELWHSAPIRNVTAFVIGIAVASHRSAQVRPVSEEESIHDTQTSNYHTAADGSVSGTNRCGQHHMVCEWGERKQQQHLHISNHSVQDNQASHLAGGLGRLHHRLLLRPIQRI